MPTTRQTAMMMSVSGMRLSLNLSMMTDASVSISAMEEVSAANRTSRKNTAPMTVPNFIESNTIGSEMNIRLGPLLT